MSDKQKNVLGEDLEECSNDPLTGWHRDGCCSTDENDHGIHTVCAKVTTEFLKYLIYSSVCYIITWKCLKKEKI